MTDVDWNCSEVQVTPTAQLGRSLWRGMGAGLHFDLAQACKAFLVGARLKAHLTKRGQALMGELGMNFPWLEADVIALEPVADRCRIWAFAGWAASLVLVERLKAMGLPAKSNGLVIEVEGHGAQVHEAFNQVCQDTDARQSPPFNHAFAEHLKFSECVPATLLEQCFAARGNCSAALQSLRQQRVILLAAQAE